MLLTPPDLYPFVVATVLLAFVPRPDLLFVLTESMLRGWRAGLIGTVGLCTGLLVHTCAVALGLAAVLQASPAAFAALRYVGGAYLIFLAWRAFRAAAKSFEAKRVGAAPPSGALYLRGVLMNVANPKVAIFFLAFLPQFTHPERGAVGAQILILGAVFMAFSLACFSIVSFAADPIGAWLRGAVGRERKLNMAASLVFLALAGKLVVA